MATKRRVEMIVPAEESDQLLIRPLGTGQEVGRSFGGIHPGYAVMTFVLSLTSFHLDHCGALPWFLEKTSFKGGTFMTHVTKAIYHWLLSDYVKVRNISADDMLYTETDLEESTDKIETIHFHEVKEVAGIKFCRLWVISPLQLLYTGDFSRQEDRRLMAAEIPSVKPDILIIESTYGTHIHEKREEREARFCNTVHDIELLLILDEYWQNHPELHDVPIYYASSLAKKCMAVYQTYVHAMNDKIRKAININNPFVFKHISNLKSMDQFDDIGPSIVMASPESSSREPYFGLRGRVCVLPAAHHVRAGGDYNHVWAEAAAENVGGLHLLPGPRGLPADQRVNLKPLHVVGGAQPSQHRGCHVMGSLADKKCVQGQRVSGILVKKNFNYHIVNSSDLSTDLSDLQPSPSPFTRPYSLLVCQLRNLTGDLEELDGTEKNTLNIFKSITLVHEVGTVLLEVTIGSLRSRVSAVRNVSRYSCSSGSRFCLVCLQGTCLEKTVDFSDDKNVSVTIDGKMIPICLETRSVCCGNDRTEDESLRETVDLAVQRLYDALNPII
uniref:Uncharacterized protein n=1 Tax=Mola mola TaxID=94237 RepID=A0A3Q3WEN9_MOLML